MTQKEIQQEIDNTIDQLGQALCNADWHFGGVIEKDRIQDALRTLMGISNNYRKLKSKQ